NAGRSVRPANALDMNHALHVGQYVGSTGCSRTLVAPMVAPTAGANRTAAAIYSPRARKVSSLGGTRRGLRSRSAAVTARATLAPLATTTHVRLHSGQWTRMCAATPASRYQIQCRHAETTRTAVRTAYGMNRTEDPFSG